MTLYLDSAYVAKCYLNEPDAPRVRSLVAGVPVASSAWCVAEVACVFHRHVREGALTRAQARQIHRLFEDDVAHGAWSLVPVTDTLMQRVQVAVLELRKTVFLRAGDAVHLISARSAGFSEVWTNDRHLLAAATAFGLKGRTA